MANSNVGSNIYDSVIVPEAKLKDGVISRTHGIEWTEEQICRLNWTMLELSHRIIVGSNKDIILTFPYDEFNLYPCDLPDHTL